MGNKSSKKGKMTNQELKDAFNAFDKNESGVISVEEFRELMCKLEGDMTEPVAQAFIKAADKNKDGTINFKEFKSLWTIMRGDLEGQATIRDAFERLDIDDNGYATKEELKEVIKTLDSDQQEELLRNLDSLDADGDGKVSYPEFMINWKFS